MKRFISVIVVLHSIIANTSAQEIQKIDTLSLNLGAAMETAPLKGVDVTVMNARHMPEYAGGRTAWRQFLMSHIKTSVPVLQHAPSGTYLVRIRFMVGKTGELRDVSAESNCGYGMEEEVIRVIKSSPIWKPAYLENGIKISTVLRSMVTFHIKGYDCKLEMN